MGKLKDELLIVYRQLAHMTSERDRLAALSASRKHRLQIAEESLETERKEMEIDRARLNQTFRELDEENAYLVIRSSELERSLLALIDDALDLEHFIKPFIVVPTPPVNPPEPKPVAVEPAVMQADKAGNPVLCLSCGQQKDGTWFCSVCFDLSNDHDFALFEELLDAWSKGARDFPRPNKNAKELYKK